MRLFTTARAAVLMGATLLCLEGQVPASGQPPRKETPPEFKGIPARATPADYQFQAQAGTVTIAAEFTGHSLPTAEGPLTTDDFVAVEVALFGPSGARLRISSEDFSLRVNGKKTPLPSQQYGLVFSSLKDPEWEPPEGTGASQKGSKTSLNSGGKGGGGGDSNGPPAPVKIPVPVMRAMALRVQKAALPEGDRALPQAGLIFFGYRSKTKNMQSIELIYEGPAGKAVVALQK